MRPFRPEKGALLGALTALLLAGAASAQGSPAKPEYERAVHEYIQSQNPGTFVLFGAVRTAVGLNDAHSALTHLRKAMELDREFAPALELYASLALQAYRPERIADALQRIDQSHLVVSPAVSSIAIRLELARDSVARAEQRWDALPPASQAAPIALYAHALLLFREAKPEAGLRDFEHAVTSADTSVAAAVQRDIEAMFGGKEAMPHGSEIMEYWRYRSALSGESTAERIAEHYGRLHEARRDYQRKSTVSFGGVNAVVQQELSASRELDPRGVVYVRRGKPFVQTASITPVNKQCWVYEARNDLEKNPIPDPCPTVASQREVFVFSQSPVTPDWILVDGFGCDPDEFQENAVQSGTAYRDLPGWKACKMSGADVRVLRARQNNVVSLKRETIPKPEHPLPFYFSVQTLRELQGNAPIALVVIAVPASSLKPVVSGDGVVYNFRATIGLVDAATRRVQQKDTTLFIRMAQPLAGDALLRAIVEVPAVAGAQIDYRVRIEDLNSEHSFQTYAGAREIGTFPAGAFAMSDLLFARSNSKSASWMRGDQALDLMPVERFRSGVFDVFFELYNAAGGDYNIDILISEKSGGLLRRKQSMHVAFKEELPAASDRVAVHKSIKLELPPDAYIMRVTVTDPRGHKLIREREVVVTQT